MRKYSVFIAMFGMAAASRADVLTFVASLTGGQETPSNASPAVGNGQVQIDTSTNTLSGFIRWKGLTGGAASGSHVHVGLPGTAGDVIYNYGVAGAVTDPTDSTYLLKTFSLPMVDKTQANSGGTGYNGILQTPAQQVANWFLTNHTYMNIHNAQFAGGEIRGQLQAVPEPTTLAALGLGAVAFVRRRASSRR